MRGFAGRVSEAQPLLEEALATYERLEARRDVNRVLATLRALGIRKGRRGPRQRPKAGWQSLTETEHQVVQLVTAGLTNARIGERLFVSRRTVETHLSHIFAKLGVASRKSSPLPPQDTSTRHEHDGQRRRRSASRRIDQEILDSVILL